MDDTQASLPQSLAEAVKILRNCTALADRLVLEGVTIELQEAEVAQLLNFEKLILADYSPAEWSYLRVASGVKVSGVAALTSYLARYRLNPEKQP